MSLLTARIGRLVEGVLGVGAKPSESPGYCRFDLPTVYVRGVPREVVVGLRGEPGESMPFEKFRSKVLRGCRHVEGMRCGLCSDVGMVERAVRESGLVRCLPAR